MGQYDILEALAREVSILQPDLWQKHKIPKDSTTLNAIRRKNLAIRIRVKPPGKRTTYGWQITGEGIKYLSSRIDLESMLFNSIQSNMTLKTQAASRRA